MEPVPIPVPVLGVRRDLDREDVPPTALADAENMIFRDGEFRVRPGFNPFATDVGQRPLSYIQYETSGTTKIVQGTNRAWHVLTGSSWVSLAGTPLTGTERDFVVFRSFVIGATAHLIGTNGADTPKIWNGSAPTYSDLGGSPPKARCMCSIFNRVILANLLTGPNASPVAIDVSADKNPNAGWGAVEITLLADTSEEIVSMIEMGTFRAAVIKPDSIYLMVAQDSLAPFRFDLVKTEISGPPSASMAFRMSDGQVGFVGRDGMLSLFNGASVEPAPYAVQKYIADTMNPEKLHLGWTAYDSTRRELWIIYPMVGSSEPNGGCMIAIDTFSVYPVRFRRNMEVTAGAKIKTATGVTLGELPALGTITQTLGELGSNSGIRRLVIGESGGQSFQDTAKTDDGNAIPFFWETPVQGKAEKFGTVKRVRHRFKPSEGNQNVSVELGRRNEAGEVDYWPAKTINVGSTRRKITGHRKTAEYFGFRYSGNATKDVVYQGASIYVSPRGRR